MFCNKNVNKYALNFPIHSGLRGRVSLPVRWIGVHLELKAVWTRNLILLLESIMVPLFCLTKQQHKRLVSAQSKGLCREVRECIPLHCLFRTRGYNALLLPFPTPSSKAPGKLVGCRSLSVLLMGARTFMTQYYSEIFLR